VDRGGDDRVPGRHRADAGEGEQPISWAIATTSRTMSSLPTLCTERCGLGRPAGVAAEGVAV